MSKPKRNKPRRMDPIRIINVGPFALMTGMVPGEVWIQHESGDGMATAEAKFAKHLAAYFNRQF